MALLLLSSQFWPIPSMSRRVINSVKQRLSHPLSRIESIDQWAVDPDPFLTLTTSAKIGKTAITSRNCFSDTKKSECPEDAFRFSKHEYCIFIGQTRPDMLRRAPPLLVKTPPEGVSALEGSR